jgi:hypothetical protein
MSEYADELRAEKQRLRMGLDAHKRDHHCTPGTCMVAAGIQTKIIKAAMKLAERWKRRYGS